MPPRSGRLLIAGAIFFASLAIRSLYAVDLAPVMYTRDQPGTRMALRYDAAALGMLRGDGILFPKDVDPSKTGLLARPPGYALFLRTVYAALGRSFFTAQLIQNVLNSLSPVLLFLLAARLLGTTVGAISGFLAALSPQLGCASNLLSPDALSALPLLAASLLLAGAAPDREPSLRCAAAAGILIGLSAWLRPNLVLMGPFLAVALLALSRSPRRAAGPLGLIAAVALLALAPITLRNYAIFGELIPISINGGLTLWQGVADAGGERFGARTTDRRVAREEATRYGEPRYSEWWAEPDGIWRDRERYRRSLEVIRENPLWYLGAMVRRMGEMLSYHASEAPLVGRGLSLGAMDTEDAEGESPREDRLAPHRVFRSADDGSLAPLLPDGLALAPGKAIGFLRPMVIALQNVGAVTTLPMLLLGTALLLRRDWRLLVWLAAIPIYYLAFESIFIYEWRVATPMHYHLFALAGVGWSFLATVLRGAARRSA